MTGTDKIYFCWGPSPTFPATAAQIQSTLNAAGGDDGDAQRYMDKWFFEKGAPKTEEETIDRFRRAMEASAKEGHVRSMIASLPKRLQACIEAQEGPIDEHTRA